mgnify:CR=1 FL=1
MAKVLAIHIDQNGQYKYYLNAGYLLSYVKKYGHDVIFFIGDSDITIKESACQIMSNNPDCIIFTLAKYNYNISISLSAEIKKLSESVKILFGGFFAAGNAELILKKYLFVDACFLSEGEKTLLSILNNINDKKITYENVNHIAYRCLNTNKIVRVFNPVEQIELNEIPTPYNGIIDPVQMNQQYGCVYISSSRGCKFACTYCYHPLIRKKIRHFDINHVVGEIKLISNKFNKNEEILIDFWDDFFISDRDYTIMLCKKIKEVQSSFGCTVKIKVDTRIDYIDNELLNYMKLANFYFIGFGLENTNPVILNEMCKLGTEATKKDYVEFLSRFKPVLAKCKELKIRTGLYIIHGWHNETLKMAKKTLKFCECLSPDEIHQNQLTYYKGSKIYPKNYDDEFYLYYYKNPELYKYNLDKVPDSRLDPFIEHFSANHKFLILTGIKDSKQTINDAKYFQNVIFEGELSGKFIYDNCKMNTCISLLSPDNKTLFIQTAPLYETRYDKNLSFKSASVLADKWHRLSRKNVFKSNKNNSFYPVEIKNNKFSKYMAKGVMNCIPQDICSIGYKCACEDNFRIFVDVQKNILTCKNGIILGTQDDSAEKILIKYNEIKDKNEKKFGCNTCVLKDCCSKCPKMLKKYGNNYCKAMENKMFDSYQKHLQYLEKRYYYERPENTKDFYFVKKSNV